MRVLRTDGPYDRLVGVGGIGTGIFFALEGNHTLGRDESRPGALLAVRDYCKLHIVIHYIARLLGARSGGPFQVAPVGKIGDDAPGRFVLEEMQQAGIDTRLVKIIPDKPTLFSVCFQYPDGSGGNITTNNSAAAELGSQDLGGAEEILASGGKRVVALCVPEVSLEVRHQFLTLARRAGGFRAASFVPAEIAAAKKLGMFQMLDLVALNELEAAELLGCPFSEENPTPFIEKCSALVRASLPGLRLIVSVGKAGAYGFAGGTWNFCPAPAVKVASTAGSGDALLGGVIAALAAGVPFVEPGPPRRRLDDRRLATALEFGVMLASYTVLSPHTIHPDACLDTLADFAHSLKLSFGPALQQHFTEDKSGN